MVFQHMALFPHRTVRDNVAFPLQVQGEPKSKRWEVSQRCLSLVNLDGYEDRFPSELSGGMQQRVGLARALASDPEVLLMDEPFSALDPLIRRQLQEQFMALSAELDKTTVFITHDLDEAIRIGSRIAIMKDGRIVQIGTPEEIVTDPVDDYVRDFVEGISTLKLPLRPLHHGAHRRVPASPGRGAEPSPESSARHRPEHAHRSVDRDRSAHRDHRGRPGRGGRRQGDAPRRNQGW